MLMTVMDIRKIWTCMGEQFVLVHANGIQGAVAI